MEFIVNVVAFAINQGLGFVVGGLSSFLASVWFARWSSRRNYKQYGTLIGTWIEANDLLADRPFSICSFYFCPSDGNLKFEGHSFDNNADMFYRWWSIVLHIDDRERRMSYIYETQRVGDTKKDEGFGCNTLSFNKKLNRWDVIRGYFLDLDEARPRYCRMLRFEDVASYLRRQLDPNDEKDQRFVVKELLRLKDDPGIRALFGW
jgi:hypothetical protein